MELQARILKVDIFLVWIATVGFGRIEFWLFTCQTSSQPGKFLMIVLTAVAGSMVKRLRDLTENSRADVPYGTSKLGVQESRRAHIRLILWPDILPHSPRYRY